MLLRFFFKNKLLRLLCKLSGIFLFDLNIPSQKHCIYTSWCSWSLKKVVKENNLPNLLLYWTSSSRKIASSTTRPVEKWANFFYFSQGIRQFQAISSDFAKSGAKCRWFGRNIFEEKFYWSSRWTCSRKVGLLDV